MDWRGLRDSPSARGRTSEILLCGSWWVWGVFGGGCWCCSGTPNNESRSKRLSDLRSGWRRDGVDDVGRLAKAEIFVADQVHGRGSRGGACAFEKTKGSRAGREMAARGRVSDAAIAVVVGVLYRGGNEGSAGWLVAGSVISAVCWLDR